LLSDAAKRCIELEEKHGAHNYHPLPVVLTNGKGKLSLLSFWIISSFNRMIDIVFISFFACFYSRHALSLAAFEKVLLVH
jgi:hypothetical protein